MVEKMSRRVLGPAAGVPREIGLCLSGMEEVREQLRAAVSGMSTADIGRCAISGAHSVGALVLHIGEAEWWWMQCIVFKHEVTEKDARAPFWDVLKEPDRVGNNGYTAEFCLNQSDRIRAQTRDLLATFVDDDLDRLFRLERDGNTCELNLRWILHHLI